VLDTGIDMRHPDLDGVVASYVHDNVSADDVVGHGTHVSGIIAAKSNNAVGITGICPCQLHVWKIFGDEPASDGEYYVDEVRYQRALNGARTAAMQVVNLSIGGTASSQTEQLLFRRLVASGTTVIAAMGNEYEDGNPTEYPASYPNVIAVGATNESSRRAPFSNTGNHISLVAPGTNILSTLPMKRSAARTKADTEYAAWSGTSMATPHVTAAAALILANHPGWSPAQVASRLKETAAKVPEMGRRARTTTYGSGLLNLPRAVS
jgi:subtilisin family serine protease